MIKILETIDTQPFLDWYNNHEKNIVWTDYGYKGKQSGIQYKENDDCWTSSVGRSQGNEELYTLLNPFYIDSIIEKIIVKYNLFRTRFMWVGPYSCYSMHADSTPRIHIPLVTNKDCYFLFKHFMPTHLEEGKVWFVDTTKTHTFINCSDQPRLHIVGAVSQ